MKQLIVIAFLLIPLFTIAQNTATVSGRLIDKETSEPIPFASVAIKTEKDSVLVTGALTNDNGQFTIEGLKVGNYSVNFSFIGYTSSSIELIVNGKNNFFDLGKITLEPSLTNLESVTVAGEREAVAGDLSKKVFTLDDNLTQVGGSVLDAMKNLPGVTIDQEGKILLRGSDKVAVLIDGKQTGLTGYGNQKGLATIPMSNIERIEIINNPSAKYDATGMAGILNIIYKKESEKGWNGDIGLALGIGALGKRRADLPTDWPSFDNNKKITPSLSLNRRSDKSNFYFQSEVLSQKKLPNNEFTTRYYDNGDVIASQVPENRKQTQYVLKTGIDLFLDESNTLSISTIFDREHHTDTAQVPYIDQQIERRQRYWSWREEEITGHFNVSADFKHKFSEPGRELKASIQYTRGWEDEEYFLNDSSDIRISTDRTHLIAIEHTIPVTLDYVKPLRQGRFETGGKLQIRRLPITYDVSRGNQSVIYEGLGDKSDWGENLYAGYFNYVYEQRKFDIEAGLRAEYVDVFYDLDPANIYYDQNDAYNYFEFYPNVRFSLRLNENNILSVFYNRRVDRPGEPELRVFAKYDDPELLKVGNPYLRPQFTQTVETAFNHDWSSGSIFMSVYYRQITDPFMRVYSVDNSDPNYNIVNKIYQNVGSGSNLGIELLLSQSLTDWWKASGSFNWYVNTVDAYSGTILFPYERPFTIDNTKDNTWDTKINNQFTVSKNTELQLSYLYFAPKNIPQGRQFERSSMDIGAKRVVFAGKGEITLSFSDVFNRFGLKQEFRENTFRALYENYYETQVLRVGFKYKF